MTTRPRTSEEGIAAYVAEIPAEHRSLFDRVHRLILETCPEAEVGLAYKMPTYVVGGRRLHVGVWKHGVSIYGWKASGDGGFTNGHPELRTSTGTIRITSDRAGEIADAELRELVRTVLTD